MFSDKLIKTAFIHKLKRNIHKSTTRLWNLPNNNITFNEDHLLNPDNFDKIKENIENRKCIGNIERVHELFHKLKSLEPSDDAYKTAKFSFEKECSLIPNQTHPEVLKYNTEPKLVKYVGEKRKFDFPHKEFHEITKRLNLTRTEQLGNLSGSKTYFLLGQMAELEQALVRYFLSSLLKLGFNLISVPDILPRTVVESCGMNTQGERTQVYTLDPTLHPADLCLSGTSEIALAGSLINRTLNVTELPLKLCSVSRCYRAETSSIAEERGIFRVHEFTKVEMFIVSKPEESDSILEDLRSQQEHFFESLNIHFQVLDMPAHELGAPAYRKYDIEAWMPGRNIYGEISSCSNCTDFQSRRLNIRYKDENGNIHFVHTLNGTACAVPRLLITLVESYQQSNGVINIPQVLQKYMQNKDTIKRQKAIPELKLIKTKK